MKRPTACWLRFTTFNWRSATGASPWRGTLSEAIQHFQEPRGEFVLVLQGNMTKATRWTEAELLGAIHQELERGETPSALAARLAESSGWRRREIYALTIKQDQKRMQ